MSEPSLDRPIAIAIRARDAHTLDYVLTYGCNQLALSKSTSSVECERYSRLTQAVREQLHALVSQSDDLSEE